MGHQSTPSLDDFLLDSLERIREYAPATFIYAASGTRRAAVLSGLSDMGDEYARWSRGELFRCIEMIFQHGVKHLFMPMLEPSQFQETTENYQEHLWRWYIEGLSGPEALAHYQGQRWRVRFALGENIPQLQAATELLKNETPTNADHTLWCFAVPNFEDVWKWVLEAAQESNSSTYTDAVLAVFGEKVPPASLYLGTVKPLLSILQLPPLIMTSEVQCYWSLRPGYSLDEIQLRSILYDYAFTRQTWREDKTGRAEQALAQREIWERGDILGLGKRLGPFWYPDFP